MQVDDLRLALQWSRAQLPTGTEDLYYFVDIEDRPDVWRQPPETLRDALIAVAEVMKPAISVVVDSHISQDEPVIIEGDGIAPSIVEHLELRQHFSSGAAKLIVLDEPNEEQLLSNMTARNRGIQNMDPGEIETEARAKWLFARWIASEAVRFNLPLVSARPWETVADRVLDAASGPV